jgi:hypothetical protein
MPRGATKQPDTAPENAEENSAAPTFSFDPAAIEDLPEDYSPERPRPGRTRTATDFDELLPKYKDQGWKKLPYESTEQLEHYKREINKAKAFLDLGVEMNVTPTHLEFKVRDKQIRVRKPSDDGKVALAEEQSTVDAGGDNDS